MSQATGGADEREGMNTPSKPRFEIMDAVALRGQYGENAKRRRALVVAILTVVTAACAVALIGALTMAVAR